MTAPVLQSSAAEWSWPSVLSGVVPPVLTPLRGAEVDQDALARLAEHVIGGGCAGLFLAGGCGEGPWLTDRQREAVIRTAAEVAGRRVPVLVGVLAAGTLQACQAAAAAAALGASAVVLTTPYYYPADTAACVRHVQAVVESCALPAVLYNIPQCTHNPWTFEAVSTLAQNARVLGIKDSTGDLAVLREWLSARAARSSFRVLVGDERVAREGLRVGADGLVPGLANLAPRLLVALRTAVGEAGEALQRQVDDLKSLQRFGDDVTSLKAAAKLLGFGSGQPAVPHERVTSDQEAAIADILRRHGLLPKRS